MPLEKATAGSNDHDLDPERVLSAKVGLRESAARDIVWHGLSWELRVWVAEHAVVLTVVVPDRGIPYLMSVDEDIGVQTAAGVDEITVGERRLTTTDRVKVTAVVVVHGCRIRVVRKLEQWITAVVADALGTLAIMVVVLDRAKSAIECAEVIPM